MSENKTPTAQSSPKAPPSETQDSNSPPEEDGLIIHQRSLSLRYTGPLPQAQEFVMYEDACPGAGERILSYMETEQSHRHKMQAIEMEGSLKSERAGLLIASTIMASLIVAAFVLALQGNILASTAFLATGVVGVVYKFIDGRSEKNQITPEDQDKD